MVKGQQAIALRSVRLRPADHGCDLVAQREVADPEAPDAPHLHGAALSGRRALLVGEAAGIDPVTGEGIAQAIQYGAVAGAYLARKIPESDFAFGDWPSSVRSSPVGRDLVVREAAFGLFYGPRRPNVERFLLDCPDFIRVGLQHFSGKPWSRAAVARGALGALKATAGAFLDRNA